MLAPRRRAMQIAERLGVPLVVTLHDVPLPAPRRFRIRHARTRAPVDRGVGAVLRRARACWRLRATSPPSPRPRFRGSRWMSCRTVSNPKLQTRAPSPGPLPREGSADARPEFLARRPERVVAVLGAIGAHKGADLLRELPDHLQDSGIGIVVIGYLDQQLYPAGTSNRTSTCTAPTIPRTRKRCCTPTAPSSCSSPTACPRASATRFRKRGPRGCRSSRVPRSDRRARGPPRRGWLLPERFGAVQVATELRRLLAHSGGAEVARVKSELAEPDTQRVPDPQDHGRIPRGVLPPLR
jgi:hypothetical protein